MVRERERREGNLIFDIGYGFVLTFSSMLTNSRNSSHRSSSSNSSTKKKVNVN